ALERAVRGMDRDEVGDVVPVVAQRRGVHRQDPETVDAEPGQVVEPLGQSGEVADAVAVAVHERLDVDLVEDGVLVPVARSGHGSEGREATTLGGWPATRRAPA